MQSLDLFSHFINKNDYIVQEMWSSTAIRTVRYRTVRICELIKLNFSGIMCYYRYQAEQLLKQFQITERMMIFYKCRKNDEKTMYENVC